MTVQTRVLTGGSVSAPGGGITEGAHELLDTLTHNLAESAHLEFAYTGKNLDRVTVWTDVGMTLKIREAIMTYTGKNLTGVSIQQFDGAGTAVATLSKTLTYTGKDLTSIAISRS